MKVLVSEQLSPHKYKTPEGYLICRDAILARTGKQEYKRGEVFGYTGKDSDDDTIEIDRKEEEVFSNATLASFENKPITVEHPSEDVNSTNWKEYQVGFVRDVRRGKTEDGEDVIIGNLVIQDAQTIEEIENGEHCELSCGYDCDIKDEENPQQRNIRGNHVALCEQGRAGIARIVDSKIEDSLSSSEKKVFAKKLLECNTDRELMEVLHEILNYSRKIYNDLYDIFDRSGSTQYKAGQMSDYLMTHLNDTKTNVAFTTKNNRGVIEVYADGKFIGSADNNKEVDEIIEEYKKEHNITDSIKDSKIKLSRRDADDALGEGDGYETDWHWYATRYNVRFNKNDHEVEIIGSKSDLNRLMRDYHLSDYRIEVKDSIQDEEEATIYDSVAMVSSNSFGPATMYGPTSIEDIERLANAKEKIYFEQTYGEKTHGFWKAASVILKELKTGQMKITKIYDSAKDENSSMIEFLIKDEEEAIEGYERAIEQAKQEGNEKAIARFQEIIDDEMEHIQELKALLNSSTHDSSSQLNCLLQSPEVDSVDDLDEKYYIVHYKNGSSKKIMKDSIDYKHSIKKVINVIKFIKRK